ncbi:MAG: hypothetical protein AAGG68_11370 [Bacteroidota bacterium]
MKKLIFFLLMSFSLIDCIDCDISSPEDIAFGFRLVNKVTGADLIKGVRAEEKIRILDEDGEDPDGFTVFDSGTIFLRVHRNVEEALEQRANRTFLLYLNTNANPNVEDIDTLQFEYEFGETKGCPKLDYTFFKVSYNDSLYHEGKFIDATKFFK